MGEFKGTPGPWRWEVNLQCKGINLCGGETKYDLTVMDFVRYGTGNAAPRFNVTHKSGFQIMERAETMVEIVPGREHHASWFQTLNHPDAQLIASAPDLLNACMAALKLSDETLHTVFNGTRSVENQAVYNIVKAAINKALGEKGVGNA